MRACWLDQAIIKCKGRDAGFGGGLVRHLQQSLVGLLIEIWGGLIIRGNGTIRTLGSRRFDLGLLWRSAGGKHQHDGNQGPQHAKCTYAAPDLGVVNWGSATKLFSSQPL